MANKYCGKLAYRGEGRIGTIREYYYSENSGGGAKPTEKFVYRPLRSKQTLTTTIKPVMRANHRKKLPRLRLIRLTRLQLQLVL